MTGNDLLVLLLALAALVVTAGAVAASTAALLGLVRELLALVFTNVGRLFLIGACLVCLFLLLFHGSPPSEPGVG